MPGARVCGQCGEEVSGYSAEGLCPKCMLLGGLDGLATGPLATLVGSASGPTVSEIGNPNPSIGRLRDFGDYELLEEIARGGMGIVYKARQVSLNRIVAVKMILAGQLANASALQRFLAEVESAANLHHPNIVAIYEVGEHEGQQYFSMEYVEGQSLAELVRERPLAVAQAARYTRIIAEAVQYAHEHGILHRDLKPSNVLLDEFDQPRITDFGLAKQVQTDSGLTMSGQVLGTPSFIPPEQAGGKRGLVGPASDVYSVGAILYHLLTARPPFVADTVTETLRLVEEAEPVSPRLLNPGVPRDLETICLKCLEKNPAKRYASSKILADELGHVLRDEPIQARPVTRLEKIGRWGRRKPMVAALLALLVFGFLVGLGSVLWEWNRAERALKQAEFSEKNARKQAGKSEQVVQFLQDMLHGVGPSVALGRDTKLLQVILDKTSERVGKDLTNEPQVEAELRNTLGGVYAALGQDEKAERMYRQALALEKQVLGNERSEVATTLNNLALVLNFRGRAAEAETVQREALSMQRRIYGNEHPDVATSINNLALVLTLQGKLAEAETFQREALAMQRKLLGNEARNVGIGIVSLGNVLRREGKLVEAEALHREGLALMKKRFGSDHPDVAFALCTLAAVLEEEGKLEEAEAISLEELTLARKLWNNEHRNVAISLGILARVLEKQNKLPEAEARYREALVISRKTSGDLHPHVANVLDSLVQLLLTQHRYDQAEEICSDLLDSTNSNQAGSAAFLTSRGVCRVRAGQWSAALADFVRAVDWQPDKPEFLNNLIPLLIQQGSLESYRRHCGQILIRFCGTNDPAIANLMAKNCLIVPVSGVDLGVAAQLAETAVTVGKDSPNLTWFQLTKGLAKYRQGQFASAVEWILKVLEKAGDTPSRDAQAYALLAMACQQLQREDGARSALGKGVAIERERLSAPNSGDLGEDWRAWITARALLCEAQALIGPSEQ